MEKKVFENKLKIILYYFSATGNTKKIADVVKRKLLDNGVILTVADITSLEDRNKIVSLEKFDAVIFGFPIYSLRAPRICREWIEKIEGNGMRCSVFFTYGGFGKEPAHYYMQQLLKKKNFNLVSTAEFLGAHTFNYSGWRAATGRPNDGDMKVAEKYAIKTLERFNSDKLIILDDFKKPIYTSEQIDEAEKYRFNLITKLPTRDGQDCSMCNMCENLCPTLSMNAFKGEVENDGCIGCFRCIANCPDNVLHTNSIKEQWQKKLDMHNTTEADINNAVSKIML